MNTKRERICAYCGLGKCEHTYRYGRKHLGHEGGYAVSVQNITTSTTLGEMRKSLAENLPTAPDDTPGVWMWSFTKRGKPKELKK